MKFSGLGPSFMDRILRLSEFPSPGGHAVVENMEIFPGGSGANTTCGLSGYGVESAYISVVGADDMGEAFVSSMTGAGVDCSQIEVSERMPTGIIDCFVDEKGERTFVVFPNSNEELMETAYRWDFSGIDILHLDSLPISNGIELTREIASGLDCLKTLGLSYPYASQGIKRLDRLLREIDMVFLNEFEFDLVCGKDARKILDLGPVTVVVTLGARGAVALKKNRKIRSKGKRVDLVVDTTGAGDAFTAGFLLGHINELPEEDCMELGNIFGAHNVGYWGGRKFLPKEKVSNIISGFR